MTLKFFLKGNRIIRCIFQGGSVLTLVDLEKYFYHYNHIAHTSSLRSLVVYVEVFVP